MIALRLGRFLESSSSCLDLTHSSLQDFITPLAAPRTYHPYNFRCNLAKKPNMTSFRALDNVCCFNSATSATNLSQYLVSNHGIKNRPPRGRHAKVLRIDDHHSITEYQETNYPFREDLRTNHIHATRPFQGRTDCRSSTEPISSQVGSFGLHRNRLQ